VGYVSALVLHSPASGGMADATSWGAAARPFPRPFMGGLKMCALVPLFRIGTAQTRIEVPPLPHAGEGDRG
jgi:hypothetical protein